jgi:hypothetical protein
MSMDGLINKAQRLREGSTFQFRLARARMSGARNGIQKLTGMETLDAILRDGKSIARFGDGEIGYCLNGKRLRFQRWHRQLAERMQAILIDASPRVLPTYYHVLTSTDVHRSLVRYDRYGKQFDRFETLRSENDVGILMRARAQRNYARCWTVVTAETSNAQFGETSVFFLGGYLDEYAQGRMGDVTDRFRRLFDGRRILFVAPEKPLGGPSFTELEPDMRRLGLRSAQYVAIPNQHAFEHAHDIEAAILAKTGYDDIFIQAGPMATWMASALADRVDGRVLDVGALNTQVRHLL